MLRASEWNAYRVVIGQRERNRQNRKWEDNIKTDLKELGWRQRMGLFGSLHGPVAAIHSTAATLCHYL